MKIIRKQTRYLGFCNWDGCWQLRTRPIARLNVPKHTKNYFNERRHRSWEPIFHLMFQNATFLWQAHHCLVEIIQLFQCALEDVTLKWFNSLKSEELRYFTKVIDLFRLPFCNKVQRMPTIIVLLNTTMKLDENFMDYVTRWTDLYSKSGLILSENQFVDLIMNNAANKELACLEALS